MGPVASWCEHGLLVALLVAVVSFHSGMAQKRARPVVADLEMLIQNDAAALSNEGVNSGAQSGQDLDKFVSLTNTLKKIQDLERYYSHLARPRYGRSVESQLASNIILGKSDPLTSVGGLFAPSPVRASRSYDHPHGDAPSKQQVSDESAKGKF